MKESAKLITQSLDRVASHLRRGNVWDDWLDFVDANLRMLPLHVEAMTAALLRGEEPKPAEDDDETKELWQRLERAEYDAEDLQHFGVASRALMESVVDEDGTINYRDVLAIVHEDWAGANTNAGQYLTPYDICHTMALLAMQDVETMLADRITAAVGATTLEMLGMNVRHTHTLRYVAERYLPNHAVKFSPITVCDPACGSGTFFLACAAVCPQWAVQMGLIRFYGQDIDRTAVQMSRINLMSRGMNGYGLRLRVAAAPILAGLVESVPQPPTINMPENTPAQSDIMVEAGMTDLFGKPSRRVA